MRLTVLPGPLITALFVSACSGSVDGPLIEGSYRSGGTDALVSGSLVIESECLYLQQPGTDNRYPVVWQRGTSWDSGRSTVVLRGGTLVREGDLVSVGGGYHSDNLGRFASPEGVALALACADNQYGEIAVFNSGEGIDVER